MSYGCQKDYHIESYRALIRATSPVPRRSTDGSSRVPDQFDTLVPLTDEERDRLLTLGGLGLAGEAGEVVDMIKKATFHGIPLDREKFINELGDVLWYIGCLGEALDVGIEDIAQANTAKVRKRYPNGFKKGGGIR